MKSNSYALGVDVGGTFTDLALIRLSDGHSIYHKVSSTPDDPSRAIGQGIEEMLKLASIPACRISYFGHGTTIATNAVIVNRMARTGLITTQGFRDILEIRRQRQPHNYNIRIPKPRSPVPRHLRREINERTFLFGCDPIKPTLDELTSIADEFRNEGVEAIAVCLLHSYHNPDHEMLIAERVRELLPGVFVCASHEVLGELREYERFSTTVVNASLGPIMNRYLNRVSERVKQAGVVVEPNILQSNGGVASPEEAGRLPVRTLASGPAAGVIGAIELGRAAAVGDFITFDVGGTSTDVCLVANGEPMVAREREFAGNPVRFPMVDIHSVGAGGGSIAWVDAGGFLHVGPKSAGAHPGPAAYGCGGNEPTVTDANIVLGRLSPDALLGGRMLVRKDLARKVIEEKIAKPMKLSVKAAAQSILTILNENMIQAIRVISVEQGYDPRDFWLYALGGAGPLLASPLARELSMRRVVVPPRPGLLCALGLLMADTRTDFSLTRMILADLSNAAAINTAFGELERQAEDWFEREGVAKRKRKFARAIDMRYVGQSHELRVPLPRSVYSKANLWEIEEFFVREHERVYGYTQNAKIQLVTFRVTASAEISRRPVVAKSQTGNRTISDAIVGQRPIYFDSDDCIDSVVYDRMRLPTEVTVEGPAIIEQMDTTILVFPDQILQSDNYGNIILSFGKDLYDHTNPVTRFEKGAG